MKNFYLALNVFANILLLTSLYTAIDTWSGYQSLKNKTTLNLDYANKNLDSIYERLSDNDLKTKLEQAKSDFKYSEMSTSQETMAMEYRLSSILFSSLVSVLFSALLIGFIFLNKSRFKE